MQLARQALLQAASTGVRDTHRRWPNWSPSFSASIRRRHSSMRTSAPTPPSSAKAQLKLASVLAQRCTSAPVALPRMDAKDSSADAERSALATGAICRPAPSAQRLRVASPGPKLASIIPYTSPERVRRIGASDRCFHLSYSAEHAPWRVAPGCVRLRVTCAECAWVVSSFALYIRLDMPEQTAPSACTGGGPSGDACCAECTPFTGRCAPSWR